MRWILLIPFCLASPVAAQTCTLEFTVEVTQGVGLIRPGTHLPGSAHFSTTGQSFRQEGGATAHLAMGTMTIRDDISGPIWTLITTSRSSAADLVGVYARHIEGLSYGGLDYSGPMALTLFGPPGSRPEETFPTTQADWDDMNVRRAFFLHAHGADMLSGNVLDLTVECH